MRKRIGVWVSGCLLLGGCVYHSSLALEGPAVYTQHQALTLNEWVEQRKADGLPVFFIHKVLKSACVGSQGKSGLVLSNSFQDEIIELYRQQGAWIQNLSDQTGIDAMYLMAVFLSKGYGSYGKTEWAKNVLCQRAFIRSDGSEHQRIEAQKQLAILLDLSYRNAVDWKTIKSDQKGRVGVFGETFFACKDRERLFECFNFSRENQKQGFKQIAKTLQEKGWDKTLYDIMIPAFELPMQAHLLVRKEAYDFQTLHQKGALYPLRDMRPWMQGEKLYVIELNHQNTKSYHVVTSNYWVLLDFFEGDVEAVLEMLHYMQWVDWNQVFDYP